MIRCGDLYERFVKWAEAANLDRMNIKRFGLAMKEKGYKTTEGSRKSYIGIGIPSAEPFR